jgi:hypothetical protein
MNLDHKTHIVCWELLHKHLMHLKSPKVNKICPPCPPLVGLLKSWCMLRYRICNGFRLWDMTCTLVDQPQYSSGTCCLHFQLLVQNSGSTFLNSDGTYLQNYTLNLNTYICQKLLFLINNTLHSIFPSLQDNDYLNYNCKVGTAAYRTLLSGQYQHKLRSYNKTLLKPYTNVRTLV